MKTPLLAVALTAIAAACAPAAPAKSTTVAEVATMDSMSELMVVKKAQLTGLWGKDSFTDAQWAQASDASPLVAAAAKRVAERFGGQGSFDDGFVDFANEVATQAEALGAAAASKDAAAASAAMVAMDAACDGCHGVYN